MSVAGVIVTHGPDPELPRAVAALGPQVDELVVVANPPAPETDAQLIVNEHPLGFAANVNKGVAATSAPYVVVANPDTEPRPGRGRSPAGLRRDPSARRNRRAAARLPGRPASVVAPAIPDRLGHARPPHAAPPLALPAPSGPLRPGRAPCRARPRPTGCSAPSSCCGARCSTSSAASTRASASTARTSTSRTAPRRPAGSAGTCRRRSCGTHTRRSPTGGS